MPRFRQKLHKFLIHNTQLICMYPISELNCKSFQFTMITNLHAPRFRGELNKFLIHNIELISMYPTSKVIKSNNTIY